MDRFAIDFPQDLVIAFDSVWTANENIDTVTRIDPQSGAIKAIKVEPGFGPQSIEASEDAIWTSGAGGIDRIDPTTNSVVSHIDGTGPGMTYAFGSLWAAGRGELVRIDPETASIADRLQASEHEGLAPNQGCGVSAAAESLWLACATAVDRIDPKSGGILATIRPPRTGLGFVVGAGSELWLASGLDPFRAPSPDLANTSLDRIDPETMQLIPSSTVKLVRGAAANMGLADGLVIWFPTTFGEGPGAGMLYEFDAASGTVIAAFDLSEGKGYGSNAIAFGYGSLWAASGTANQVRRFPMPPG